MDKRIEFLYASVLDAQSTIRAIDVKSGFMFVILFAPIYNFGTTAHLYAAILKEPSWFHWATIANILIWLSAITSLLTSVAAISKPAKHVAGADGLGAFYSGDLFSPTLLDVIFNCRDLSLRTVEEEAARMPETEKDIILEITFEKIKLSYIRAIKAKRFTFCIWATFGWIITGLALYILYL